MGLFEVFGQILKQVANKNEADPTVETAEPVVFEDLKKKIEEVETNETTGRRRGDIYKDYSEKVREAQRENEASTEVKTADNSVYDNLMKELERLQQNEMEDSPSGPVHHSNPEFDSPVFGHSQGASSMPPLGQTENTSPNVYTNSNGGSLQLRTQPEMGAPKMDFRVPDRSLINVLQLSENSIILDGQRSRFALIEYQGQRGWILESYLQG